MTVLTPANAFPNLAFPQHLSGQTATVESYAYPGAVWPQSTGPAVLSYTNAFPNLAFPQHLSGQTATVQSYRYPGAVQPIVAAAATVGFRRTLSGLGTRVGSRQVQGWG